MIGGPVHGLAAQLHGLGTVTHCSWSTDQDPSKTNQRRLSSGNTDNRSTVRGPMPTALGSRSTGLDNMVKEPQVRFKVAK